jgi:hypothetical protein
MAKTSGIIKIHGKEYATVAHRVQLFQQHLDMIEQEGSIRTSIVSDADGVIVMRAEIWMGEYLVAVGHAEEVRGSSNINKTSALENCETSAVGRALGYCGFGSAESIASADEVKVAIARQKTEVKTAKDTLSEMAKRKAVEAYMEHTDNKGKEASLLAWAGVESLDELTIEQINKTHKQMEKTA